MSTATMLIHCPDKKGIILSITNYISRNNGNIVDLDQHVDSEQKIFFMRVEWTLNDFSIQREKISAHFDSFDYETDDGKTNWEPGGQRMITVIAYLNDVEEGGETGFPELGIDIPPKKGDAVVFHNTLPIDAGAHPKIHPRSLHGGMPVLKGEKWMVNLWFRENLRY